MKKFKSILLVVASFIFLFAFSGSHSVDASGSIPHWFIGNWKAVNGKGVYVGIRKNTVQVEVNNQDGYWKPVTWKTDPDEAGVVFGTGIGRKHSKTYFVLVKQKIEKKWYMIMTMKLSNKIKPSDLKKHPMIMQRY